MPIVRGYPKRRSLGSRSIRALKKAKSSKIFFKKSKSKSKITNYTNSETKFKGSPLKSKHVTKNDSEKEVESFAGKLQSTEPSSKADQFSRKRLKKDKIISINNLLQMNEKNPENCEFAEPNPKDFYKVKKTLSIDSYKSKEEEPQKLESVIFISLNTLQRKKRFSDKISVFSNHKENPPEGKTKKTPKYQKQFMEKVHRKKKGNKTSEHYRKKDFNHLAKIHELKNQTEETTLSEQDRCLFSGKDSLTKYSELDIKIWPCREKENTSIESVSKINKKYIESLLQLASIRKKLDRKVSKNYNDYSTTTDEMKHKLSKKIILEVKNRGKKKKKYIETPVILPPASKVSLLNNPKVSSVKVLRVLTKSDNQFKGIRSTKLKKFNVGNCEIKSEKKITDGRNDRKKRKHKNYTIQITNKDCNDFFPSEISNAADLKELWRRDDRKMSENSLTSQSTCVVEEIEEINPNTEGMESYNKLKKIVHDEVLRISKNFGQERDITDIPKEDIQEIGYHEEASKGSMVAHVGSTEQNQIQKDNFELKTSLKSFYKRLTTPISENFKEFFDKSENLIVKRRIIQGKEQKNLFYGQMKEKSEYVPPLYKDTSEEIKIKLKRLAEEKNPSTKIPSQLTKTWPLVQRLQKAFLALGSPTFPEKDLSKECAKVKKNNTSSDGFPRSPIKKFEASPINDQNLHPSVPLDPVKSKRKTRITYPEKSYLYSEKIEDRFQNPSIKKEKKPPQHFYKAESTTKQAPKAKLLLNKNSTSSVNNVSDNGDAGSNQKKNCQLGIKETQNFNSFSRMKAIGRLDENVKILNPKKLEVEARYNLSTRKRLEMAKKLRDEAGDNFNKKDSLKLPPWETFRKKPIEERPLRQKTFEVLPKVIKPRKSDSCSTIEDNTESDVKIYSCTNRDFTSEEKIQKKLKNKPTYKENINTFFYEDTGLSEETQTVTEYKNPKPTYYYKINPYAEDKVRPGYEREIINTNKGVKNFFKAKRLAENNSDREFVKNEINPQEFAVQKDTQNVAQKAVKERLIVSIQRSQDGDGGKLKNFTTNYKYLHAPVKTETPVNFVELDDTSDQSEISLRNSQLRKPQIQIIDITPPNYRYATNHPQQRHQKSVEKEEKGCQPSVSILSSPTQNNIVVPPPPLPGDGKKLRSKPVWEQDIKKYREIVKDIMNQYKRIDGLLTQGQRLDDFQYYPKSGKTRIIKDINKSIVFAENSHTTDIEEYRKKVMSEYQKLSIFDYKSKLKMANEHLENDDLVNFGGLLFVQELNSNNDVDVKDFQPNVHKVLDSQIYVDASNLEKEERPKDKKLSLHEVAQLPSKENRKLGKTSLCF